MKKFIFFVLILMLSIENIYSQIGIFPHAVFLNMKERSSNLKVYNNGSQPKEINIEIKFGYSGYDSLGKSIIIIGDSLPEAEFSAAPYVKVYPKKLILQPGEEQVVRLMAGNYQDIKDGTYFCRIFLTSKMPPREIDTTFTDKITTQVDFQFTLIAAVILQKGNRNCSISLSESGIYTDSTNINILVNINHMGNTPFLGTAEINVYDMDGNKVDGKKEMTPVYFSAKKAFFFPKAKFTKGKYQVEITMSNEHKDVPEDYKTPIQPVKAKFTIDLTDKL